MNLKNILATVCPVLDFVYLLQLEEYKAWRYIRLYRFFFRRHFQRRGSLDMTQRVRLTIIVTILLESLISLIVFYVISISFTGDYLFLYLLVLFPIQCLLIPVYVLFAHLILEPFVLLEKQRNLKRAKMLFSRLEKKPIVIGITGSYGKTSTKNFLVQLLSNKFRTVATPGTINTDIGIAEWLMTLNFEAVDVLIVEMGAYKLGEIRSICDVVPPDFAIITALGDQHMSRFKTIEQLVSAKLEIFQFDKPIHRYMPIDYKKKIKLVTHKYSSNELKSIQYVEIGLPIMYKKQKIEYDHNLSYQLSNLSLALAVAEDFDIAVDLIAETVKNLHLPDRRGNVKRRGLFEYIDNSYNITPTTARMILQSARRVADKNEQNLCVITAGIIDLLQKEVGIKHVEFGSQLDAYSDCTILIDSIFCKYIVQGYDSVVKKEDCEQSGLIWNSNIQTEQDAWEFITNKLNPEEWLVLCFPELPDQYH